MKIEMFDDSLMIRVRDEASRRFLKKRKDIIIDDMLVSENINHESVKNL